MLGVAGVLGRGYLAQWLNRDIERIKRDFQSKIESEKAQHQRDLEDYRLRLIGSVERAKAEQVVATAAAVKFSEYRFFVINDLNKAIANIASQALSLSEMQLSRLERSDSYEEWVDRQKNEFTLRIKALNETLASASIFMGEGDFEKLQKFSKFVDGVVKIAELEYFELIGHNVSGIDMSHMDVFDAIRDAGERKHFVDQAQKDADNLLRSYALRLLNMESAASL